MALYVHQQATLGELEGSGYLFRKRTALGDVYQGVFFGPDGESTTLESLVDEESVTFSGVLYKKTLSGKISETKVEEIQVDVTSYREVSMGDRALLEATEV